MDIIYDIECYPNIFTVSISPCDHDVFYVYEISSRRNDIVSLILFLDWCQKHKHRMVGFNNLSYDYPLLHHVYTTNKRNPETRHEAIITGGAYRESERIISTPWEKRFSNIIQKRFDVLKVSQVDLLKIHHLDNVNKLTGLKTLEINMRLPYVEGLPFPPGTTLDLNQIQSLVDYNKYDVYATKRFYEESEKSIKFRDELTVKFDRDFTNYNDTKIGKEILVMELEARLGPDSCYSRNPRKAKQTIRGPMKLGELIFPEIKFRTRQFNEILAFFRATETNETKGVFKDLSCTFPDGLECHFGMGGVHAFRKPIHVRSCRDYAIIDLDVEAYYPSLGIERKLYPAHLSSVFYDITAELKAQRAIYAKGTQENEMFKLANNGSWGASNDKYSCFYDKRYAMQITINGQLLLCMFAEMIMTMPDTLILQMNTDGLTIKIPRGLTSLLETMKKQWEKFTGLNLEQKYYTDMFLKNVNSYLAVGVLGDVKKKKDYSYKLGWHQNHSMLIVPRAAEAHLIYGAKIGEYIRNHADDFDFCISTKLKKTQKLMWGAEQVQGISRFYVSKTGRPLVKIDKQLAKVTSKKQEIMLAELAAGRDGSGLFKLTKTGDPQPLTPVERKTGIMVGRNVTICNDGKIDRSDIDYDFYIGEVLKLTEIFTRV